MNLLKNSSVYYSALAGLLYGLACRLLYDSSPTSNDLAVMSLGFLTVMPFAVGFISVFLATRAGYRGVAIWLGLPVLTTLALLLSAFVLFWEGILCLTMMMPVAMLLSVWGGVGGGICARRRLGKTPMLCVAVLPFLVSTAEHWAGPTYEVREVATSIAIQAPPQVVWQQIERVRTIQIEEQRFSWSQKIGFPRPLEATLSGSGIGAVRHATFAGGVLFVETVTAWEPDHRLGFDIRADTAQIPPGTLDEHVTIGGPYFDALHGEYRIERRPDGGTILHLVSHHRLSTTFNFYARLWVDAVMQDIQQNILYVIRNRCEDH